MCFLPHSLTKSCVQFLWFILSSFYRGSNRGHEFICTHMATHSYTQTHGHTLTHAATHTDTRPHTLSHMQPHTTPHTHGHTHTRPHTHTHKHTRPHTHTRPHSRGHTHTHTHGHTHTRLHIHTHRHCLRQSIVSGRVTLEAGSDVRTGFTLQPGQGWGVGGLRPLPCLRAERTPRGLAPRRSNKACKEKLPEPPAPTIWGSLGNTRLACSL